MATDFTASEAVHATVALADSCGLPIRIERLHHFLIGHSLSLLEISMVVDELTFEGRLAQRDDLVCLAGREDLFDHHAEATRRALAAWPLAKEWAERVGQIPFVRMVAVTGGLAAGALAPDQSIDFFIVVRPRRLWSTRLRILRTMQAAAKAGVTIVPVYITTTRSPEIKANSAPMAWELAQLVVVVGDNVSRTVRRSNQWVYDWLPNAPIEGHHDHMVDVAPSSIQKWAESLLLLPPFRLVENWTRHRQITEIRADARKSSEGRSAETRQFSTEVCDEHMATRAAATERTWLAAIGDS